MADNVAITPGSGDTVAADDIGTVKYQRVKVNHGADGSATDVSTASPLPVRTNGGVSVHSDVASSATSVTLLASNADRIKFIMYNDSTQDCYVYYQGAAASTTDFTWLMPAGSTLEEWHYTGEVRGIWSSASGSMRITEIDN